MSLKKKGTKPKKRNASTKYPQPSRKLRSLREMTHEERKIMEIGDMNRELAAKLAHLYEDNSHLSKRKTEVYGKYRFHPDHDSMIEGIRKQEKKNAAKIESIRNDFEYHMEAIKTLREKNQLYREIGREGYEHTRLEPTPEALYFRKVMRREYGKGLKFDIDGSHVTMTFDHWDDSGMSSRVVVEIAHRMGLVGFTSPYGESHPKDWMDRHIKEHDGYGVAEFEVGHLDMTKKYVGHDLEDMEY